MLEQFSCQKSWYRVCRKSLSHKHLRQNYGPDFAISPYGSRLYVESVPLQGGKYLGRVNSVGRTIITNSIVNATHSVQTNIAAQVAYIHGRMTMNRNQTKQRLFHRHLNRHVSLI